MITIATEAPRQLDMFAEFVPVAKRCDRCRDYSQTLDNHWGECSLHSKPGATWYTSDWKVCDDYTDSPTVDFDAIRAHQYHVGDIVNTVGISGTLEDGGTLYCYCERIRLVEQRADGKWVGVIDMGLVWGKPWGKDGTRIVMSVEGMTPDRRSAA